MLVTALAQSMRVARRTAEGARRRDWSARPPNSRCSAARPRPWPRSSSSRTSSSSDDRRREARSRRRARRRGATATRRRRESRADVVARLRNDRGRRRAARRAGFRRLVRSRPARRTARSSDSPSLTSIRKRCAGRAKRSTSSSGPIPTRRRGVPAVIRTGKPVLLPVVTDEMLVESAEDEEHLTHVARGRRAFGDDRADDRARARHSGRSR